MTIPFLLLLGVRVSGWQAADGRETSQAVQYAINEYCGYTVTIHDIEIEHSYSCKSDIKTLYLLYSYGTKGKKISEQSFITVPYKDVKTISYHYPDKLAKSNFAKIGYVNFNAKTSFSQVRQDLLNNPSREVKETIPSISVKANSKEKIVAIVEKLRVHYKVLKVDVRFVAE